MNKTSGSSANPRFERKKRRGAKVYGKIGNNTKGCKEERNA
jgi:hypothetical protein